MPKRPRDDDEDDFEVVEDDDRPKKKKRPPAKETRSTRMDETDEYEERPRRRDQDEEDADDDRPRKRKKPRLTKADRARMREEDEEAREKARENMIFEWTGPIALTFCGVLMTVISGVILARRTEGLLNPPLLLAVTTAWTLLLVPVVIVSLMVIGSLAGIDYGTLKNAVRSLVAITFFVNGIYWLGNLTLLGWFLSPLIAGIVTFALFRPVHDVLRPRPAGDVHVARHPERDPVGGEQVLHRGHRRGPDGRFGEKGPRRRQQRPAQVAAKGAGG